MYPFLKAISPSAVVVFQYIEGAPVPIPVTATVSDTKETTKMVIEPETRSFNSRYVVMTTDAPQKPKQKSKQKEECR